MNHYTRELRGTTGDGISPGGRIARGRGARRTALLAGGALVVVAGLAWMLGERQPGAGAPTAGRPPAHVVVSAPLQEIAAPEDAFLGQFSAVDSVELRAQVGGTLTEIHFTDGQIVHKGDLLFVIDPRPYQIKLAQAEAQLQTAQARQVLTSVELDRAQHLKRDEYGTAETVDQRLADQRAAQASILQAQAAIRDAALDLEYCHVTAPFTGRVSARQVSLGSLVSGSRAGSSPTTLLTTIVSLDPVYFDFDMSEADYLAYEHARHERGAALSDTVALQLDDASGTTVEGRLDFIDNAIDRASGTIRARATVPNADLFLTPGAFARLRLAVGAPRPVLLVPDAAVTPDQSNHVVMTVDAKGAVAPKLVQVGELVHGLRTIASGLRPDDRVIIDGLMMAQPGSTVVADQGAIKADTASQ